MSRFRLTGETTLRGRGARVALGSTVTRPESRSVVPNRYTAAERPLDSRLTSVFASQALFVARQGLNLLMLVDRRAAPRSRC